MADRAHSTARRALSAAPEPHQLPATTWLRHAAHLRELALTGAEQHRRVYREAAREAEAHAQTAHQREAALAAADASILAEAA